MLKHCHSRSGLHSSPMSNISNSLASLDFSQTSSVSSEVSFDSSFGSTGGSCSLSPGLHMSSRSSLTSASEPPSLTSPPTEKVSIKIFASCLRPDIEYKTLSVGHHTRSRDLIWQLLGKFKMKHRDPKLFYLTMEVVVSVGSPSTCPGEPITRTLILDDEARPAELSSCNPWPGQCKFSLQTKKGGLVRVYDSVLMRDSQYKSLLISEDTTVQDVVRILFHCYGIDQQGVDQFCLYEHCRTQSYDRKLNPEDRPLAVQDSWLDPDQFRLVVRRAPKLQTRRGNIHQLGLPSVPVHSHAMTDMGSRAIQANLVEKYSKFCQKYESYFYV